MADLTQSIMSQLSPETISQVARQLGVDEATAQQAVAVGVPVIVSGLANESASTQGANNLAGALGLAEYILHQTNHFRWQGLAGGFGPALAGAGKVARCSERLVDFVGQAGNHLAERAETADVSDFCKSPAFALFGLATLADVSKGADGTARLAVGVAQGSGKS